MSIFICISIIDELLFNKIVENRGDYDNNNLYGIVSDNADDAEIGFIDKMLTYI